MNDQLLQDSWWLLSRARGAGLAVRALTLAAPLLALGVTSAAGHSIPAINIAVTVATLACVLVPDSHIGLFVVALIGVQWLVTVDNPTTPWTLAAAAAIGIFHTAQAAAIAVPPAAKWTRAMIARWVRRYLMLTLASGATWILMRLIDSVHVESNATLLSASLVLLAAAGLWVRAGSLPDRPSRRSGR